MEDKKISSNQLYDRQIQEDGEEAQQSIQKSKVMIWGIETASSELVKNLALIGFGLVLVDDRKAVKERVMDNPLTTELDADKNKTMAQLIKEKLNDINPTISIEIKTEGEAAFASAEMMALISSAPYSEQLKRRELLGLSKVFLFFIVGNTFQKLALCEHKSRKTLSQFDSFANIAKKINEVFLLDIDESEETESFVGDFHLKCIFGAALTQILIQIAITCNFEDDLLLHAQNMFTINPNNTYVFTTLNIHD